MDLIGMDISKVCHIWLTLLYVHQETHTSKWYYYFTRITVLHQGCFDEKSISGIFKNCQKQTTTQTLILASLLSEIDLLLEASVKPLSLPFWFWLIRSRPLEISLSNFKSSIAVYHPWNQEPPFRTLWTCFLEARSKMNQNPHSCFLFH